MTHDPLLAAAIGARWVTVRRRIEEAAETAGRDPAEVRVVAVTKGFGIDVVHAALAAGLSRFGENRVQEGEPKAAAVPEADWHLIGHLQSNKVKRAVGVFDWLEGVDSAELLSRVDRAAADHGRRLKVLLQVNVAEATSQHGLALSDIGEGPRRGAIAAAIVASAAIDVVGLMAIGPMTDDQRVSRSAFGTVRRLRDELEQSTGHPLPELSMGMSADLEAAVEEGATLVRVGTALFGERPAAK